MDYKKNKNKNAIKCIGQNENVQELCISSFEKYNSSELGSFNMI